MKSGNRSQASDIRLHVYAALFSKMIFFITHFKARSGHKLLPIYLYIDKFPRFLCNNQNTEIYQFSHIKRTVTLETFEIVEIPKDVSSDVTDFNSTPVGSILDVPFNGTQLKPHQ